MSFKITTEKDLSGNIYKVKVSIPSADITSVDKDLLEAFGEPLVQVGGTVVGSPSVVALPPLERKIPSGFPHTQLFDGGDYPDAELLANTWAATTLAAITSAITALRLNADGFTGEASVTV